MKISMRNVVALHRISDALQGPGRAGSRSGCFLRLEVLACGSRRVLLIAAQMLQG